MTNELTSIIRKRSTMTIALFLVVRFSRVLNVASRKLSRNLLNVVRRNEYDAGAAVKFANSSYVSAN